MADVSSRAKRNTCSMCGQRALRHMARIALWTASQGWHTHARLCWPCAVRVLSVYDAAVWAGKS